jgi:hypothetical protein
MAAERPTMAFTSPASRIDGFDLVEDRRELLALDLREHVHALRAAGVLEPVDERLAPSASPRFAAIMVRSAEHVRRATSCQSAMMTFAITLFMCTAGDSAVLLTFHAFSRLA